MSLSSYKIIEGHDYTFPVIGYERRSLTPEGFAPKNVYGTAFSIGDNCYMTAGHSITAAVGENDVISIGFIVGEKYLLAEALQYEVVPEMDVGFLRTVATIERAKAYTHGSQVESPLWRVLWLVATPLALDPVEQKISTRSFKG